MRLEIAFRNEREFEKWVMSIGVERRARVMDKLVLTAELGGPWAGFPLVRYLGRALYEIRVGGDRIYFTATPTVLTVVTAGTKDTQQRDISRARRRIQ